MLLNGGMEGECTALCTSNCQLSKLQCAIEKRTGLTTPLAVRSQTSSNNSTTAQATHQDLNVTTSQVRACSIAPLRVRSRNSLNMLW